MRIIISPAKKMNEEPDLQQGDRFITCVFGEMIDGRVIRKGTQAKMARGRDGEVYGGRRRSRKSSGRTRRRK